MKPFFSIWISPLKTFEYLSSREDSENREMINVLSALITIGFGIPKLKEFTALFENFKFIGILIGIISLGLVGILIIRWLLALTYWAMGKLLKGKANKNQVQLVVAYSLIPYLFYLLIAVLLIIPALITKNWDLVFYRHPFTYYVVWLLALRNLIYGLSYFNKFSYGFALLNILVPAGLIELIRQLIINWKN
ncbi:MAG: YIP1 family protein [Prolixibacteraceae bacterium]